LNALKPKSVNQSIPDSRRPTESGDRPFPLALRDYVATRLEELATVGVEVDVAQRRGVAEDATVSVDHVDEPGVVRTQVGAPATLFEQRVRRVQPCGRYSCVSGVAINLEIHFPEVNNDWIARKTATWGHIRA
jgi:hypothetical protein